MNKLARGQRIQIVKALVDGNSMRATARIADVSCVPELLGALSLRGRLLRGLRSVRARPSQTSRESLSVLAHRNRGGDRLFRSIAANRSGVLLATVRRRSRRTSRCRKPNRAGLSTTPQLPVSQPL